MPFGQLVCGSPGAGKSTYCAGVQQFHAAAAAAAIQVSLETGGGGAATPAQLSAASRSSAAAAEQRAGAAPSDAAAASVAVAAARAWSVGAELPSSSPLEVRAAAAVSELARTGAIRRVVVVNLDPANEDIDNLPYDCGINVKDLISHSECMVAQQLGPNGAFLYAMEYLEKHVHWLLERLRAPEWKDAYFVFDLPGQVELFIHHPSLRRIIGVLQKEMDFRLCLLNLVDCIVVTSLTTYVSALTLSLSIMIHLELPHVNVLSKWDLVGSYGDLAFPLEYYTDVQDLSYLQDHLLDTAAVEEEEGARDVDIDDDNDDDDGDDDGRFDGASAAPTRKSSQGGIGGRFGARYRKLTGALCTLVEEFALVSFVPLDVQDRDSMHRLAVQVDKANGYLFGALNPTNVTILGIRDAGRVERRPAFERMTTASVGPDLTADDDDDDDHGGDDDGDGDDSEEDDAVAARRAAAGPVDDVEGPLGAASRLHVRERVPR